MELLRKQTIAEAFASVIRDAYQNNPDAVHAHIERSMMRVSILLGRNQVIFTSILSVSGLTKREIGLGFN